MHAKATFVFWTTLIFYLLTLFTASYVGVYLTYVAIPVIIASGLIMKCAKPKHKEMQSQVKANIKVAKETTNEVFGALNDGLESLNNEMSKFNAAMQLKMERTEALKVQKTTLEIELSRLENEMKELALQNKISPDILKQINASPSLKELFGNTLDVKHRSEKEIKADIKALEDKIDNIDATIGAVKMACEAEVEARHSR